MSNVVSQTAQKKGPNTFFPVILSEKTNFWHLYHNSFEIYTFEFEGKKREGAKSGLMVRSDPLMPKKTSLPLRRKRRIFPSSLRHGTTGSELLIFWTDLQLQRWSQYKYILHLHYLKFSLPKREEEKKTHRLLISRKAMELNDVAVNWTLLSDPSTPMIRP